MNTKLLLKTILLIGILLLLVIMGMNNRQIIELEMPPLFAKLRLPGALMYFAFFALGVLGGTLVTGGKKGGGGWGKGAK
jgi:uncharacterized integral membrane protein